METTDLAMVSRIRVEVRGGSMEAAERVAFLMFEHAQQAGYIEGITPQRGEWTDHFFNYPQMTSKSDSPDPWSELGMRYAGRLAFTYYPEVAGGGYAQGGFEVTRIDDYTPHGLAGHEGSEREPIRTDVTGKVIVLDRRNEVKYGDALGLRIGPPIDGEGGGAEASVEEILDNIRRLVNVREGSVEAFATMSAAGEHGWTVKATRDDGSEAIGSAKSLRDAALDAYGQCGQEVTHYDTRRGGMPSNEQVRSAAHLGVRGDE